MGDRRHWMCTKTLFKTAVSSPFILYTESLRKSGLERLDDRRDMTTQSLFRQIKDPKHPLHYLLPLVKVSRNQMVHVQCIYMYILGQCYLVCECACVQLNEVRYRADRRRRLQKMTSYTEDEEKKMPTTYEEEDYNLRLLQTALE